MTERANYNIRMSNLLTVFEVFLFFFHLFCFPLLVCYGFLLFFFFISLCFCVSFVLFRHNVSNSVSDFLLVSLLYTWFKIFIGRFLDHLDSISGSILRHAGMNWPSAPNFNIMLYIHNTTTRVHLQIYTYM